VSFIPPTCSSEGALSCETDSITVCPPVSGVFDVEIINQADAVVTRIAASASVITAVPANTLRKNVILWNDSTSVAYIKFGSGASSTDFTWRLSSQSGYELPMPVYIGEITAVWESANGGLQVTELI
jgi:hypothetical protein